MPNTRVVITGMGVVASNALGLPAYEAALREGLSGIRYYDKLKDLKFGCQVGGIPQGIEELKKTYFSEDRLLAMNSSMLYAGIAGLDCWRDAGFSDPQENDSIDWDTGAIIGTGIGGADTMCEIVAPQVTAGNVRRLGSSMVEQTMASSVSALVGGLLGLGGQVTTNSSACSTGTEAVINAYYHIKEGRSLRMLAGGAEGSSHFIWGCFDSMRVLGRGFNDRPEQASRPMSASTGGFIPGSGSGILMLESLESALSRGAKIYAEVRGGHINSGGQRGKGSMTSPNPVGVQRCIKDAMESAGVQPSDIDVINGHLTGTMADPLEFENWSAALGCSADQFPLINSTKSMIGHALGAAGGLECVASVLQVSHGFVHGSINCEDLHPSLVPYHKSIVQKTIDHETRLLAKASFGFGDVNACVFFQKWTR
ncbi:MAG: beta-ketoacyl-[acyl-carrier-protein] synthase family protein [Spirochaetales bacterium]|nr:beta-ketoacyl-[acyl-carrier-protein] synthase family protein [Spirochaetales bacterium]